MFNQEGSIVAMKEKKLNDAKDRAVLITGCSSGIGRATAVYLAQRGYTVFAGVRRPADAQGLGMLGLKNLVPLCPLDLTQPGQISDARVKIDEELASRGLHGLYAVVNNASGGFIAPLELMDIEKMRVETQVRILGPIALLQAMLPLLREGRGRVLWIATPSLMPIPFDSSIHACDFAANCLSRTLNLELLPWGIPSVQIRCGGINTASVARSYSELDQSMRRWSDLGLDLYDDALKKTEEGFKEFDKKRSEPEIVAKTVHRALEAKKMKSRYHAGYMSGISSLMEVFPQPLIDHILSKR
jgi:NAD(P)-dependent dehydrogenase (short-subunit alcohol dehydrogenase family)